MPAVAEEHRQIEPAFFQALEQHGVPVDADLDADQRMSPLELSQRRRQPGLGKIARQTEPHDAFKTGAAQRRDRFVIERQHPPCVFEKQFTGLGQHQAATLFAKQALSDLVFQLAHLLAE